MINDCCSKATIRCRCLRKFKFNEGVAIAWSNISIENFDIVNFLNEDDKVKFTYVLEKEIDETLG